MIYVVTELAIWPRCVKYMWHYASSFFGEQWHRKIYFRIEVPISEHRISSISRGIVETLVHRSVMVLSLKNAFGLQNNNY